jgi:hypothetical protein
VHVRRQRAIGLRQQALVVVQPRVGALGGTAGRGVEGETAGERLGALLEQLDAGDLVAERPVELGRAAADEEANERGEGIGQRRDLRRPPA